MNKNISILIIVVLCLIAVLLTTRGGSNNTQVPEPIETATTSPGVTVQPVSQPVTVVSDLTIPWDIAFLPNGEMLVTERPGNLLLITATGTKHSISIPRVIHRGEGGLLGVLLHPNFANNQYIYLYMTVGQDNLGTRNAVIRYSFVGGELQDEKIIIDGIPGAIYHDGGRMEFGPDGKLYVTTGDATSPNIAQDLRSLGGKILRINDDGTTPPDNPFQTRVYSYGHRNPQGLTWDDEGRLWETEHGRSGVQSGLDELNLIVSGGNYGWPEIEGDESKEEMIVPARHSGAGDTWAPASAVYWDGSIFFGGLKGEALYEAVLNGDSVVEVKEHFKNQYGRIRSIRVGPDDMFYITTSNKDGRGNVKAGDDKIIKVDPRMFR